MPNFEPTVGREVALNPPPGFPAPQGQPAALVNLPQRGAFAMSETLPLVQEWATKMHAARTEWERLRIAENEAKAEAKRVRANLMITLRVFGNEATGGIQMKHATERNEWADADANVQAAELAAALAQTAQMVAKEAYEEAARVFDTIRSMMAVEREDFSREWHKPR